MARNGHTATTTKAAKPNDIYDSLSRDGQDQWDAMGSVGYRPFKGAGGVWFAKKAGQKDSDAIGPSDSLSVLRSMVDKVARDAANKGEIETFDEMLPENQNRGGITVDPPADNITPINGNARMKQPYLPGAEDIEELDQQADVCLKAQDDQQLAKSNFSEAKEEMKRRLKAHGRTNYKRGGWNMTIKNNEVLELKQDKNRGVKSDKPIDVDPDSEAANVIDPQD